MPRQVNTVRIEEFCSILFHALDRLDGGQGIEFLPFYPYERPHAYEKYPRLLMEDITRFGNVEAGYQEWASKIVRDASDYHREELLIPLTSVKHWLITNRAVFEQNKENVNHFKRSLLYRVYEYLIPRRKLVMTYAETYRGKPEALNEEIIQQTFEAVVCNEIKQLEEIYGNGERLDSIICDAKAFLLANRRRLQWTKRKIPQNPVIPTIVLEQKEIDTMTNFEEKLV